MLLTLSTTYAPATDLGYLLGKNPTRVQTFDLAYGKAHVFYPEATAGRCTAALALDVDPIGLVRGRPQGQTGTIAEYVNDRPYVASSLLSVAIAQVYGSALAGRSRERPELADTAIPLDIGLSALPCHGGEALLRRLFAPLGYDISVERLPLDPLFPAWGDSLYFRVRMSIHARLQDVLSHLYVLIPVLDDEKHYWVGDDEVEKLVRKGEGWLGTHPERTLIAMRYLKHRSQLARVALNRLVSEESADPDATDIAAQASEERVEKSLSLQEARMQAVAAELRQVGAQRVLDLGCGEGKLLRLLLRDKTFTHLVGVDVSTRALEVAAARLHLQDMTESQRRRIELWHGALTYRDKRYSGFDAATLVEVIEHLDPDRLPALERVVFEFARPQTVIVTTPNVEYNATFPDLSAGQLRHNDHRFEWTRADFHTWTAAIRDRFGYGVRHAAIGPVDATLGPPTQMAVFTLGTAPVGGQP